MDILSQDSLYWSYVSRAFQMIIKRTIDLLQTEKGFQTSYK